MGIDEIGVGELKDMVQGEIDWENLHIRKVPRFLRDHWLLRTPLTLNEVGIPTCGIHNAEKIARPTEEPATPSISKEYSDEELEAV